MMEKEREFKERWEQQDRSHKKSLDEMRQHYEYIKKQTIERELLEQGTKHQTEKVALESQCRASAQRVLELDKFLCDQQRQSQIYSKDRTEESETWRLKCSALELDNFEIRQSLERETKEHEYRISVQQSTYRQEYADLLYELKRVKDNLELKEEQVFQ